MMNAADVAILAVLVLSSLFGLWRGFVVEAFSLLRWIAAFWVAWAFGHRVADFYGPWLAQPTARIIAGYVTCFLGVLIVGALLALLVRRLARGLHLRGGDHVLGMLFGLARGLVLVTFVVLMLGFTAIPRVAVSWRQSRLLPPFEEGAAWVAQALPPDVSRYLEMGGNALPELSGGAGPRGGRAGTLPALPATKDLPALPSISISGMRHALDRISRPAAGGSVVAPPATSTERASGHAFKRGDVGQ
ncbi:MAG: CvpA family protein [Rhodanobacteraceae bacterium]